MLGARTDISRNKPKSLTPEMLERADIVISMGCLDSTSCPARLAKAEDGGLPDPKGKTLDEVIRIRDEIRKRVFMLLEEI